MAGIPKYGTSNHLGHLRKKNKLPDYTPNLHDKTLPRWSAGYMFKICPCDHVATCLTQTNRYVGF